MSAGYLELNIQQGEKYVNSLPVSGLSTTKTVGSAQLRQAHESPTAALTLSVSIVHNVAAGSATLDVSATAVETAGCPPGNYVWDLFVSSGPADTSPIHLLFGPAIVSPRVTR